MKYCITCKQLHGIVHLKKSLKTSLKRGNPNPKIKEGHTTHRSKEKGQTTIDHNGPLCHCKSNNCAMVATTNWGHNEKPLRGP